MTDRAKPTPGPFYLDAIDKHRRPLVLGKMGHGVASFHYAENPQAGPSWDEAAANAALFVRAQHMDELVEAVKAVCSMQAEHYGDGTATHMKLIRHCGHLRAILAKIDGAKP